jgi:death-on-curing family protein
MVKDFVYPSKEFVVFVNEIVSVMSARKADRHKILRSDAFIDAILDEVQNMDGDLFEKAARLLMRFIKAHGFASGNKRTAFIVATHFISANGGRARIKNFEQAEKVLKNVRRFETSDIVEWLRKGEIDETKI